jgi:prepilin-type N-terminal cleavage/methylation domain-containing protein
MLKQFGFTVLEGLIVLAIVAILVVMVMSNAQIFHNM